MKKKIVYNKKTNRISMVLEPDADIDVDKKIFKKKVINLTEKEYNKLNGPNANYYKNNKFESKPFMMRNRKKVIDDIKVKLKDAKSLSEVKNEIVKLINIL